ncbi:DcaP family trimeric outer membrane transporter [uncultured Ferrimonas sp.]|uniref:DcaP family trimeric outer membrane transporter n=1 Tax=uncultured Ferrimonas sp. TaxID=432640 RepID=UPI00262B8BE3|nr:DcaP family trimeric outer membrane transporter [uncultured Ferrimonas sp.]
MISHCKKLVVAGSLLACASPALAGYEFDLGDGNKLKFGGYIKIDTRYVDGDVAYRDFWIGGGTPLGEDKSQFKIFANETRFNTTYTHGDVTGFLEFDLYGGGGNEIISNSYHPRLRHAFIKYQDWLVGQTWTTYMNTSAIPESADFAGATVGLSFIRQGQIRYSNGGFQLAIENPESFGGDPSEDGVPDFIGKYTHKADWGNVSASLLARQLNTVGGNSESAFGYSLAGRINSMGKDDFRFQLHLGETGRYTTVTTATDLVGEEVEETTSFLAAYRHYWNDTLRSTVLYGYAETDITDVERAQWSVNIFDNLTKELAVGFEVGNFEMKDANADSFYGQFSMRYTL